MALVHGGADEGGQNLVAIFYSNPLMYESTDKESGMVVKKEVNPALDHLEESRTGEKSLSDLGRQIRFCSEPATVSNVRKRLDTGCNVLHFTGPGCSEYLSFEDGEARRCGIVANLNEEKLRKLFQAGATKPGLVFLISPFSHTHGTTLTNAGVPHVVAVELKAEGSDEAARIFSQAFYRELIARKQTVKDAFDIAISTVNIKAPYASNAFLLLPSGRDHEVRMFNDLAEGGIINETRRLPPMFRFPRVRRKYFDAAGLQHAVQVLQDPNAVCVSIIGDPGVGKTERALQACHYVRERAGFDAMFYADCKQAVISSPTPFPSMEGFQPEIERPYKQHFCRLIKSALGMPPDSLPSVGALQNFLCKSATDEIGRKPDKVLLVLDSVDILYETGGIEARKSMIAILDELCRTSEISTLLTCKEQLLGDCDGHLRSTKELVHRVYPLKARDSALLLLDTLPRDTRTRYADVNSRLGCDCIDLVEPLLKLKLMEAVGGHPGTLCRLGPLILSRDIEDPFWVKEADRFRALFIHVQCKLFSQTRASSIASDAGLKTRLSKLAWVEATAWAGAENQRVRHDEDDGHYHSVPWNCLTVGLRQSLSDLQITGDDETQSVDDDHREAMEGSARSFSSEGCFLSGLGWGVRGEGLGHGYRSSFKPRLFDDHHLSFIRNLLESCGKGHRRGIHSFGSNAGEYAEAREVVQGEHESNQPEDDVQDTIRLETFASFCQSWWEPVMTTLSRIPEEWASDNPVRVHGFIGRREAERKLLETNQSGVFLLRFSKSRPGQLILAFTYEACQGSGSDIAIRHSMITVKKDRRWTLHYGSKNDTGISYPSLRELLLDKGNLQTLYPRFNKRSAFGSPSQT